MCVYYPAVYFLILMCRTKEIVEVNVRVPLFSEDYPWGMGMAWVWGILKCI